MTSTIVPALKELKKFNKVNVVDVGAARASFLFELNQLIDLENVYAIGIDPISHDVEDHYDKFYHACVDNVDGLRKQIFYKNTYDDQASSLFSMDGEKIGEIDILNLNDIINENIPNDIIHFIKIDAEGKDLHIVKSLSEDVLFRTKFISIECLHNGVRYDGEFAKNECIKYFDSIGFDVFFCHDTDNGSGVSDIVFINSNNI